MQTEKAILIIVFLQILTLIAVTLMLFHIEEAFHKVAQFCKTVGLLLPVYNTSLGNDIIPDTSMPSIIFPS